MSKVYICDHPPSVRTFHRAADALLTDFSAHGGCIVSGTAQGFWAALWLAERHDLHLLALKLASSPPSDVFRRPALRNLFAVVCPVLLLAPDCIILPALPNTTVFRVSEATEYCSRLRHFTNEL